jgi:hypothetical protein
MEDDLKILKVENISNYCMDCDLWVLGGEIKGKPRGNLECGSAQPSLFNVNFLSNRFALNMAFKIDRSRACNKQICFNDGYNYGLLERLIKSTQYNINYLYLSCLIYEMIKYTQHAIHRSGINVIIIFCNLK